MPATGLLRGVAIDTALWYLLPSAFLIIYVGVLGQPAAAVFPHLLMMALPFVFQAVVELVLSRSVRHEGLRVAVSALVLALLIDAMLTYYVLGAIGVHFWGGVVSGPAIPTLLRQAPDVVESLGISRFAALALAIALMTGVLTECRFYLQR